MGAAKTIYSSNYFGQICGKVCPTQVLCEGACVFNEQDILPVEIGALQSYACNEAIHSDYPLANLAKSNNKRIAVVGAGPSGIACACELRNLGYAVFLALMPDLFRLRLYAADSTEQRDRTIQNSKTTLNFGSEINMAGSVDERDEMVTPLRCRGSRRLRCSRSSTRPSSPRHPARSRPSW